MKVESGLAVRPMIATLQLTRILLAIASRLSPTLIQNSTPQFLPARWIAMGVALAGGESFTSAWQVPITALSLMYGYRKRGRFYRALSTLFYMVQLWMFWDSFRLRRAAKKEVFAFRNAVRAERRKVGWVEEEEEMLMPQMQLQEGTPFWRVNPPVASR
ncbi:hypothetical protein HDU98_005623 [Podochytrium sp. JEL0797]|nr:hypothetical protein HDU98_005623 [Podochytrium sp. JEL0797]